MNSEAKKRLMELEKKMMDQKRELISEIFRQLEVEQECDSIHEYDSVLVYINVCYIKNKYNPDKITEIKTAFIDFNIMDEINNFDYSIDNDNNWIRISW